MPITNRRRQRLFARGRSRTAGFHQSNEAVIGYFFEGEIEMFWESNKDSAANEKIDENVSALLENLSNRSSLFRFLWICAASNAAVWLIALVFHEFANESFRRIFGASDKAGIGVLLVPFFLGVFLTYSLCRLKFPDIEENNLQSEMMASYSYQARSMKRWYIWLFSICGGILNVVLLVLVNLYLNDQL